MNNKKMEQNIKNKILWKLDKTQSKKKKMD